MLDPITQHNAELLYGNRGDLEFKVELNGKLRVVKWYNLIDRIINWWSDPNKERVQKVTVETAYKSFKSMQKQSANSNDIVLAEKKVKYVDLHAHLMNLNAYWAPFKRVKRGSHEYERKELIHKFINYKGLPKTYLKLNIIYNETSDPERKYDLDTYGMKIDELVDKFIELETPEFKKWVKDSPLWSKYLAEEPIVISDEN